MAEVSTDATFGYLEGLSKDIFSHYADRIPEPCILQKENYIPFVKADKETGDLFRVGVSVRRPQGVTYAPSLNTNLVAMNPRRASAVVQAQLRGSLIALEEGISYDAITRTDNDKKSFERAFETIIRGMNLTARVRVEMDLLYGGSGIGKSLSSATAATAPALISSSVFVGTVVSDVNNTYFSTISVDPAAWAPGVWQPSLFAGINVYNASSLVGVQVFDLISFSVTNKTITLAGTQANLTTAANLINTPTQCDFWFEGQFGNVMTGLNSIAVNSGTLFNINSNIYPIFAGNSFSASSAAMTFSKVVQGLAILSSRGLMEDAVLAVAPDTWAKLLSDATASRRFDSSYRIEKTESGNKKIEFYSQNGSIEVISHSMVKGGDAFVFPMKDGLMRIGSTDITFNLPGLEQSKNFLYQIPGYLGAAVRCFSDQALFTDAPSYLLKFTNIVNT